MTGNHVRQEVEGPERGARMRLVLAGALAAAIAAAALAPPSSAETSKAPSGVTFTYASEEATPTFGAAPIAECPLGKKVLGGGVRGGIEYNSSTIVGLRSDDGPDPGTVIDDAWQGFAVASSEVTIGAYAACRAGSVVRRQKSIDFLASGERASKTVGCPRGYRVTGGGVTSSDEIEVKATHPTDDGKAWEGAALNVGIGTSVGIRAYCVGGSFAKHLVYKKSSDTADAGQQEEDFIDCYNHALVGGGTSVAGRRQSNLRSTYPEANDTWISDVDAVGLGPVSFKTYAICFKQRSAGA